MKFLSDHVVLLLGIAGAAVSLVASLSETVRQKKSRRVVAGLAILGFVTLVGQQLLQAGLDAERAAAENDRDAILAAIQGKVEHTAGVVDEIKRALAEKRLVDVGDPLVAVDAAASEGEQALAFGKGPPSAWEGYVRWLAAPVQAGRRFLTFDVNASRDYAAGLTLAYLLTSPANADQLRGVVADVGRGAWFNQPVVDHALLEWQGVDYVLFRDGAGKGVVAYAPAREFASDLVSHIRAGQRERVEEALNRPQADVAGALVGLFPSMRTAVLDETDVASVAKTMVERKWSQCVAGGDDGRFVLRLENIVRAAAAGRG